MEWPHSVRLQVFTDRSKVDQLTAAHQCQRASTIEQASGIRPTYPAIGLPLNGKNVVQSSVNANQVAQALKRLWPGSTGCAGIWDSKGNLYRLPKSALFSRSVKDPAIAIWRKVWRAASASLTTSVLESSPMVAALKVASRHTTAV